jgi:hypothetical protein
MCQALAALRLGYLSQELRFRQESVWAGNPVKALAVDPCLSAIDASLHSLSDRLNDYQRVTVAGLLEQLATRHHAACGMVAEIAIDALQAAGPDAKQAFRLPPEIVATDEATKGWQQWQQQDWTALRNLLHAVVDSDSRLAAWFDIGDHQADILWQVATRQSDWRLTQRDFDSLYSGVDRLQFPERGEVELAFFSRVRDRQHLMVRLWATYDRLCWLLENRDLQEKPHWDGETIKYRGGARKGRRQSNEGVGVILDEFEEGGWPEWIDALAALRNADISQQTSRFNQTGPICLRFSGGRVYWSGPGFRRKRRAS